jgi:WD40 repeat protein
MFATLTFLTLSFTFARGYQPAPATRTDVLGDPLPAHAVARLGTTRWRTVWSNGPLEYRPDGRLLAVGRAEDGVGLWDVASSRRLAYWPAARQFSLSPSTALSADGKVIAAVGGDQDLILQVFERETGKVRSEWKSPDRVYGLALSPDGAYLATVNTISEEPTWGQDLRLWETATGKQIREFRRSGGAVIFGRDGKTILLGSDKRVRIWDLASGKELRRLEGSAALLALSADGKVLVVAGEQGIHIWNPTNGEEVRTIPAAFHRWNALALAADGRTVAFSNDEELRAWDVSTGKELFRGASVGWRESIALSPDGRTLAWSDTSKVHRWDLTARREIVPCAGHQGAVYSLVFSPDGKRLVSRGADDVVQIWNRSEGHYLPGMSIKGTNSDDRAHWKATLSPDGRTLAARTRTGVRFLSAESGKEIRVLDDLGNGVDVVFSPDGKLAATDEKYYERGQPRRRVHVWEVAKDRRLHVIECSERTPGGYAFSRDGKLLVTAGDAVRLWDVESGEQVRYLRMAAEFVAFHPDGQTLIAGGENAAVFDLRTGAAIRQWRVGRILALALSPDGKSLATAVGDGISLWDPSSGEKLAQLSGHASMVSALAFAPQGDLLASGSEDTTILFWDVQAAIRAAKAAAKTVARPIDHEALWNDLARADAEVGSRAVWAMASEPERAVAFLRDHVKPPEKDDDAIVVSPGEPLRFLRAVEILERLGTPEAKELLDQLARGPASRWRRTASAALRRLAAQRPTPIKPRRLPTDAERLEQLWQDLGEADAAAGHRAIWNLAGEPDRALTLFKARLKAAEKEEDGDSLLAPAGPALRGVRAVAVLEHIASDDARKLLETLAAGSPSRLTREAAAALKRLKQRR